MAKKFREKLRKFNPFTRPMTLDELPKPLPANPTAATCPRARRSSWA